MNNKIKHRILRFSALGAALLVFSSCVIYAWFSQQHQIGRMQELVPPNTIFLSAAHRKQEIHFQLGEVNTNADATHKYYVFSVSGMGIPYYLLEMAHTTNNQFTYQIYNANCALYDSGNPPQGTNGVDYVLFTAPAENTVGSPASVPNDVVTGSTYFYTINGSPITGSYLNDIENSSPLLAEQSDTYKSATYLPADQVQKNAVPLYWKSSTLTGDSNAFCHNYILRVDWTGATIDKKTKETDIVYLYASTTSAP